MLLGSINYANNLGFLLTFLLAGLGLVVMLHTWRNLLGLQLQQGKSDPVFAGEKAVFVIRLINPHGREHPGITLRFAKGEESNGDIAASSSEGRKLTLDTHRRGRLQLPRLTLSTRFPSSLLQAWCYIDLPGECLVYPHPGPRLPPSGGADYLHSSEGDRGVGSMILSAYVPTTMETPPGISTGRRWPGSRRCRPSSLVVIVPSGVG